MKRRAISLAVLGAMAPLAWLAQIGPAQSAPFQPRSDYLLHCAGCHGLEGRSDPAKVPVLAGEAGKLLCTDEARAYAVQLPNVALARGLDDARVAALMNYVVGDLGGAEGFRRYEANEVGVLRASPLTKGGLIALREEIWSGIRLVC